MNNFTKILLTPVSWLYGLGVSVRNILYDEHLLRTSEVSVPTICVGNLAVGGTGKTPHVEYIVRLLTSHGYRVAVLSRGYKRKTKGYIHAGADATAEQIGDEPLQIHRKFPDVDVVVCENRVRAIRRMCREIEGLDCVVLDDAFQHRSLRCGFNILLTSHDNLYVDDRFLPAGRLRDNVHQVLRANVVVVTKCPDRMQPIDRRVLMDRLKLAQYQSLYFSRICYAPVTIPGRALVLTGIAHPEHMFAHVLSQQPDSCLMAYPDHYAFTPADLEEIASRASAMDCVVTTEKDYARLLGTPLVEQLSDRLIVLPIEIEMTPEPDQFDRAVLRYVGENKRHRI